MRRYSPSQLLQQEIRAEEYKAKLSEYHKSLKEYEKHKAKTFLVILGQCSVQVKSRLEGDPDFEKLEASDDVVGLLKKIKAIAYVTDDVQHPMWTAVNQVGKLASINQGPAESVTGYYRRFKILLEVVEIAAWGEDLFYPPKFMTTTEVEEEAEDGTTITKEVTNAKDVRSQYIAMNFLKGLDRKRFGRMLDDLTNSYISGKNNYPATLEAAFSYVSNYQHHQAGVPKAVDNEYQPIVTSFAQHTKQSKGVRCFSCGEKGHISKECPNKKKKSQVHNQLEEDSDGDDRSRTSSDNRSRKTAKEAWFR